MDWAEMLERMYLRWCQAQGYSSRILDRNAGAVPRSVVLKHALG